ncbi:fungal-specific transcription factor domain-containing protein [Xylariales sp. PMI_506]|nr:fungal-specific transcription factor domain-containing protein [Xylariales sp. PMI_506]
MEAVTPDPPQPADGTNSANKKRKRPRAIQACDRCRLKKYKCSGSYPCAHCKKSGARCHYDRAWQGQTDEGAYVHALEQQVEQLTAQLKKEQSAGGSGSGSGSGGWNEHASISHSKSRQHPHLASGPSPLAAADDQRTPASFAEHETSQSLVVESPDESEITDVNRHTNGIEFHGSTSSVALLGNLQRLRGHVPAMPADEDESLVSDLHNARFPTQADARRVPDSAPPDEAFYVKRAHLFIDAYFSGIHFIHPFIDKEDFMSRANDLWFARSPRPPNSFIALYLSLLSIGALTRTWEEEKLDSMTRFEWSRKLYSEAQAYLNDLHFSNDLETVHCLYMIAKICQNELNPHMAYMYLGQAIRTCLSAGFNRELPNPKTKRSEALSRTWWGLFSLEIEMSFSLGRPDTLGIDQYHNRRIPDKDDSEFAIISCMVSFGQIIRNVSVEVYHTNLSILHIMPRAFQMERDLDQWVESLPKRIQIGPSGSAGSSLSALREPTWCRRQRLVLELRYHNVKMLLFRPFLSHQMHNPMSGHEGLVTATERCLYSAQRTIEVIYETYQVHPYFRTWWYNTTYIMVAATVLLCFIIRSKREEAAPVISFVEMGIEVLDAMDESVVAKKSAEILRRLLAEATRSDLTAADSRHAGDPSLSNTAPPSAFQANFSEFPGLESIPGLDFLDNSFGDIATMFEGMADLGSAAF